MIKYTDHGKVDHMHDYTWDELPPELQIAACAWDRDFPDVTPSHIRIYHQVIVDKFITSNGLWLWIAVLDDSSQHGGVCYDWDPQEERWVKNV